MGARGLVMIYDFIEVLCFIEILGLNLVNQNIPPDS